MGLYRALAPAAATVLVLLAASANATNPGLAVRISQKAFDFLMAEVNSLVLADVPKVKIPNLSLHIPGINTDMWVQGIFISNKTIKIRSSSLTPNHNQTGLTLSLCFYIDGKGHYHSRARWWPHISYNGWADFSMDPICLGMTMSVSPGPDGLWKFDFKDLIVKPITHIYLTGGLHMFDTGALAGIINYKATQGVTNAIKKQLDTLLPEVTSLMKQYLPYVSYPKCDKAGLPPVCKDFAVNLSLTSPGVWVDHCYAEMQLDGFVVYNKKRYTPQPALPFPDVANCGLRMFSLLISGSMFTSALDSILGSGLIHFNVQSGKFADDPYYNKFVPGLNKTFHHQPLYVNVSLSSTDLTVESDGITTTLVSVFEILIDLTPNVTKTSDKKFASAFSMTVHITFELNVFIKPLKTPDGNLDTVFLNFTRYTVDDVQVTHSNIGDINDEVIQDLMEKLMVKGFSNANQLLNKGVVIIPEKVNKFALISPIIKLGKGYLQVGIDVGKANSSLSEVQHLANMGEVIDYTLHSMSEYIALGHDFVSHEIIKTMLVDF